MADLDRDESDAQIKNLIAQGDSDRARVRIEFRTMRAMEAIVARLDRLESWLIPVKDIPPMPAPGGTVSN